MNCLITGAGGSSSYVMKLVRINYLTLGIGVLTALAGMSWSLAQETPLPKVLFNEDFEGYAIGSHAIDGRVPDLETAPTNRGTSVEARAGEVNLSSKQLVVSEGAFSWETEAISLAEPILTNVSMNLTAIAGPEGFAEGDRVRVYARLGVQQMAPQPLIDLMLTEAVPANETREIPAHLPLGTLAEAVWKGGFVGILERSQTLRLVMTLESSRPGNYIALDDLVVSEEPFTGIEDPLAWEKGAFPNVSFNVAEEAVLSPDTASQEISATYVQDEIDVDILALSEGELCLGTVNPVESPRWHPLRNVRFGTSRFGEEGLLFTMDRPEEGWDTVTYWPALFVCQEGVPPKRIDQLKRIGRWTFPPYQVERERADVVFEPESVAPIEGDEPWVDFTVRIDSELPYPTDGLEEIEVYVLLGFVEERTKAEYRGVVEVSDDGRVLRLGYRLMRPSYGWPTVKMQIDIYGPIYKVGGDGVNNFLRVAPGRSKVRVVIPPSDVVPPGEAGPASDYAQFVLASQDRFTINVDYHSDTPIDLSTVGDGDVILGGEMAQDGRLIAVESSDDDRQVRATFEFQRDAYAYRNRGYIDLEMPSGAVSNLAGGTSIGFDFTNFEDARFVNIDVLEQPGPDVTPVFVPIGALNSALESYRFRIHYQSAKVGLNMADFDKAHLTLTSNEVDPPNLFMRDWGLPFRPEVFPLIPEVVSKRLLPDGRSVQVDYRVDKPEEGWPHTFRIKTLQTGIRDVEGRGLAEREIATVGRNDFSAVNVELISGGQILGDPDMHRLALLVQVSPRWAPLWIQAALFGADFGNFEGAYPVMGWDREILPALEDDDSAVPSVAGRFVSAHQTGYAVPSAQFDFTGIKTIVNLEIDRPEGGWDQWDRHRVPYVIQAPGLKLVPSSVIASGFLTLPDVPQALPLLFSFEEWVKQLEEQADLPEGSLDQDSDGDGLDGLAEFVLGSDLQDKQDTASLKPEKVMKDSVPHVTLTFNIRTNSLGLTAELQHSGDGRHWRSVDDDFRVLEQTPAGEGITRLCLISKEPMPERMGLFRIIVAQ